MGQSSLSHDYVGLKVMIIYYKRKLKEAVGTKVGGLGVWDKKRSI